MELIVGIIVGFIACLILVVAHLILIMRWITKQIDMARNAYDRSIAMNEKTREMLSKAQISAEGGDR